MVAAETISKAVDALRAGECVGLPTETVYGLAADGLNPEAVAKIFEIKQRPSFDPLIYHLAENMELSAVASDIPDVAQQLVEKFWPGPLTLVLPKQLIVPDVATSGLPTVAVRCPDHDAAQELLHAYGKPLTAPSANKFGRISPTTAQAVQEELGDAVAVILDGGPCRRGIESTIVDCTGDTLKLARPGSLALEEIEQVTGPLEVLPHDGPPSAPGMLKSHYAPRTTMYLSRDPYQPGMLTAGNHGYLVLANTGNPSRDVLELSSRGDLVEAGVRLFGAMRELDARYYQSIIAFPVPEQGIGRAINDRLQKAATGHVVWRDGIWILK
ncbi:MAG: threonylcarbamoyl-AMP synthase [Gammaproteobacteria bacterium]|nr:threonylcarbamoyl-AMP synthase [Gammaproteobacteria bacterium]